MKNFSPRIWQNLTLALVVVGILLLALSGVLQSVVNHAINPLVDAQSWLAVRYNAIYEFFTVPRDVTSLRQRNAELEDQVSKLQTQVISLQQQLSEAQVLYALLDFGRSRPENKYVAASVIGRDPSPFMHYIFIDRGSDDGIHHGMPVVTQNGLVGRIDAVSSNASRVELITDPGAVVNVRLQNQKVQAQLNGSSTGDVTLNMVPQDVKIQTGDIILTSGLGGSYPADIMVGQITSVRKRDTDIFQTALVQTLVDFTNLQAVLVITNFKPVDITPLQPTPQP